MAWAMQRDNDPIVLQNYRLEKTLGHGAFGKVKMATHLITGLKVAIKILSKAKIQKLDMIEKSKREINIMKMCSHPHVVQLYEVIDTPSDMFVVMEYVSGELFDYIVSKGRLHPDEARHFFQQIISGVEHCHCRNIIHRDLKPENLLLDNFTNIKIADFGLSNVAFDGDFLRTSCGSPNYAAPEVINGNLYCGPEVDVWSCGVILYALLCGALPFEDPHMPNLFNKIKSGTYTVPSHLSLSSRDLIIKILNVNPLKRITMEEIKQHNWFTHKLPAYLALPPTTFIAQSQIVDSEIEEQVHTLMPECTADMVRHAITRRFDGSMLQLGPLGSPRSGSLASGSFGKFSNSGSQHFPQTTQRSTTESGRSKLVSIEISYQLLLNQKLKQQQISDVVMARQSQEHTPPASREKSPLIFQVGSATKSTDATGNSSNMVRVTLTNHSSPTQLPRGPSEAPPPQPAPNPHSRRWFIGIQARKDPSQIMSEIYAVLKSLDCIWHKVNHFRLLCLWQHDVLPMQSIGGSTWVERPSRHELVSRGASPSNLQHGKSPGSPPQVLSSSFPHAPNLPTTKQRSYSCDARLPSKATSPYDDATSVSSSNAFYLGGPDPESGDSMDELSGLGQRVEIRYEPLKVALSLYKMQANAFLLDFQRLEGDIYSFMAFGAKVIVGLRSLSMMTKQQLQQQLSSNVNQTPQPKPSTGSSSSSSKADRTADVV